jgi:hypothetical protein
MLLARCYFVTDNVKDYRICLKKNGHERMVLWLRLVIICCYTKNLNPRESLLVSMPNYKEIKWNKKKEFIIEYNFDVYDNDNKVLNLL